MKTMLDMTLGRGILVGSACDQQTKANGTLKACGRMEIGQAIELSTNFNAMQCNTIFFLLSILRR